MESALADTRLITPAIVVQELWRLDPSAKKGLASLGVTQSKIDTLQ